MFHDLATGRLRLPDYRLDVHLHDIETLNRHALDSKYDITKLSFHAYLLVRDSYRLLKSGAALGFGCGPVVVAAHTLCRDDLPGCRIAIPGELTTAHLLFRLWEGRIAPGAADRIFTTYDQIMPMIARGEADCGIIIHEGRFVYERAGLHRIVDLGEWWEQTTHLPIPLGGIAMRKSLPETLADDFDVLLRQSIASARANPQAALPYVRHHAQEISDDVLEKHIETFVNQHSLDLGDDGRAAVAKLEEMAIDAGVIA